MLHPGQQSAASTRTSADIWRFRTLLGDWRAWFALVLLVVAVAAALYPCLDNALSRDDPGSTGLVSQSAGRYPPLANLCHTAEHALWGADPRGYHLVSVALHTLNAGLVYLLTVVLAARARRALRCGWPEHLGALVAALLFGLHPLRVEAVAWAAQRGLHLSTLFLLLSVLLYARGTGWRLASGCCYLLSLAAGPIGVPLPLVLFLLDWFPLPRVGATAQAPRPTAVKLAFLLLAAVALVFHEDARPPNAPTIRLTEHVFIGAWNAVTATWQTIWPETLLPWHELTLPLDLTTPLYLGALAAVVVALVAAVACARRAPGVTVGLAAYLLLVLPTVALLGDGTEETADRFTYVPAAVLAMWTGCGLAWLAAARDDTRRVGAGTLLIAGAIAAGVLGVLTWRQCHTWRTPVTLWSDALENEPREGPHSGRVRFELARACAASGQNERAIQHYQAAVGLRPDLLAARFGWADVLLELLRGDETVDVLRQATTVAPQSSEARFRLGTALAQCNELDAAEQELRAAVALEPANIAAHAALGHLLLNRGRAADAIVEFRAAVDLDARNADLHCDLGRAYLRAGQREPGVAALRRALELNPRHRLAARLLE